MPRIRRAASAIAALLIAGAACAQTPPETYAWPLDLPRELTSSFGEYRPGRYHMGIDLRTGPIGKDVHAAADGYVSRIRCSPYGYGKSVYIQLADGNTAVYAHLSDFKPALRDYVRAAQHAREEYTVDLQPKPGEFPIHRNEIIAKSGQTGIGVPHLHYELRDKNEIALNPRLLGVTWPDKTAPIITSLMVVPLSPTAMVENDYRGSGYMGVHDDAGRITMNGPVQLRGPVGFLVACHDPSAGGSKLGVRRATLFVDGREIFTVKNDHIAYAHLEDGATAFQRGVANWQFLKLWRQTGNDAEPYHVDDSTGVFELSGDTASAVIEVEDFAGNQSRLPIELKRLGPEPAPPAGQQLRGDGGARVQFNGAFFAAVTTFPGDEMEAPLLAITGTNTQQLVMRRTGPRSFQAAYVPQTWPADLTFTVKHPRIKSTPQRFIAMQRGAAAKPANFGELSIEAAADSAYGVLAFEAVPADTESDSTLKATGIAYDIRPDDLVTDSPITLRVAIPAGVKKPEQALIYRRDSDKKKWVRQTTKRDGRQATAEVRQLGKYALLIDDGAPQLEVLHIANGQTLDSARPAIRVRATDDGSGVESWRLTYNGKWLLTEYDPEQDLLTWEQDEDLPHGPGTLAIEVRDNAGNLTRREVTITVP